MVLTMKYKRSEKLSPVQLLSTLLIGLMPGIPWAEHDNQIGAAAFNKNGELIQPSPEIFRKWVFIGAPLTPNGLNDGKAAFPEYHHVYINPDAYTVYKTTGKFPEGTVIAKELVLLSKSDLVLLSKSDHEDGSSNAPSGRGYFAGEYNGMDVMVKDSDRFKDSYGWGFFNFGHHAPPYEKSAKAAPAESCAGCHKANAKGDMVFNQFYPILR